MSRSVLNAPIKGLIVLSVLAPVIAWQSTSTVSNNDVGVQRSREQRFVDSVLARLTTDEKLGQLNQVSGLGNPTGPGPRRPVTSRSGEDRSARS